MPAGRVLKFVSAVGVVAILAVAGLAVEGNGHATPLAPRLGDFATNFQGGALKPGRLDSHVAYDLLPTAERFFVQVPQAYTSQGRYGLVVFIDADNEIDAEPEGWQDVLDHRKLLFIAPLNAGNDQPPRRRFGLAVLAALEMMQQYQIDPKRVYVSGFSGGARMAGMLGFYQSDVFHGTIQNSGADFYLHVPQVVATSQLDTAGKPYGFFDATPEEVAGAKNVSFALITGSEDFRRANIVDVYNGGFAKSGFHAKLFDVPGRSHDTADAATLKAALEFIDPGH